MPAKERKAITKAAFAKPGACAPSTASGALSRAKITGAALLWASLLKCNVCKRYC